MLFLYALALLDGSGTSEPVGVPVGLLATKSYEYVNKRVRLCGMTDKGFKTESYVYNVGKVSGASFGVDVDKAVKFTKSRAQTCYAGILKRHDGLGADQLSSAQKYGVVTHSVVDTAYYLAPVTQ